MSESFAFQIFVFPKLKSQKMHQVRSTLMLFFINDSSLKKNKKTSNIYQELKAVS